MIRRLLIGLALCSPTALWAQASCLITTGSSTLVDFGVYSPLQGNLDGTGQLGITCLSSPVPGLPVAYEIQIGPGTGNAGSFTPRLLTGPASIDYNLYLDPSRTIIWGDGSASTSTTSGNCLGVCNFTVYGRIPGGQAIPAGQYSDDVLITIEFN